MTIVKSVWQSPQGGARPTVAAETEDSGLITHLGTALSASGIAYCQWKGHRRPDRWMSGTGDIDLLVERTASGQLAHLLGGLGFKRVATPPWLHLPGVESYLGYDPRLAHLVHVHVHYRLVIGRPWNTTIVLPIERAVLASAIQGAVFRVPAPELELVLLVARVAQRYTAREAILRPHAHWLRVLQAELRDVDDDVHYGRLEQVLSRHQTGLDPALLKRCRIAFTANHSALTRYLAARALRRHLAPFARRPTVASVVTALGERVADLFGLRSRDGKRLVEGGVVVALVGGDGAGKSTCARELDTWLSRELATLHAHFGRPPRSLITLAFGLALKITRGWDWVRRADGRVTLSDYANLLRHLGTARDRYRLFRRARRFVAAGGVVIAERYPIPANYFLAGPSADQGLLPGVDNRVTRWLRGAEERYYARLLAPDASVVLQLEPEEAVRRKWDEPADYVRERAQVVWDTDWRTAGGHVIDADRPLQEVVSDLKSLIWSLV